LHWVCPQVKERNTTKSTKAAPTIVEKTAKVRRYASSQGSRS